jgi:hypothetical protein
MASATASAARGEYGLMIWTTAGAMGKAVVRAMGSKMESVVRRILAVRTSEDCSGEYRDTGRQVYIRKGETTDVNAGRTVQGLLGEGKWMKGGW